MAFLKKIALTDFKNYHSLNIGSFSYINCFVGENGSGKTNILDAIYYLSMCKSYFNTIDFQNIKHSETGFILNAIYILDDADESISLAVQQDKKKLIKRNKVAYNKLIEHVGLIPIVMVCPDDQILINGYSEERRKLMDTTLVQTDKAYTYQLTQYNKVLQQRNALLRNFAVEKYFDSAQLDTWTQQLIEYGQPIHQARKLCIKEWQPYFNECYQAIAPDKENVTFTYDSQLSDKKFETLLIQSQEKDRLLQRSNCGIHKDDITFYIDGHPMKRFGSQGQQKSFLLAIKLAQYKYLESQKDTKPILLLDDLFDKLDSKRVEAFLEYICKSGTFGQIFITHTNKADAETIFKKHKIDASIFNIKEGKLV